MSNSTSRRNFLKTSALGLLATANAGALSSFAQAAPGGRGELQCWATSGSLRFAGRESIRWSPVTGVSQNVITIDPTKRYQEILGFGAAFTDAACYMFDQLSSEARAQLFHTMFDPSEMGLNVCRTCIGSSDYSTHAYSYDEGEPDPELKRFSIEHDRSYILPMLRQARKLNPDLFLFASPWSPPGWMKAGGSMLGGSMRRRYLGNYAQYFVKFLQAYAAEGVPIQAVTPQNEVDTDQDGRMPACIWPQEYEIEFVGRYLGPQLEQNGLSTKIWILDHNYNLWGRVMGEFENNDLRKYCNAIAWHGYYGEVEMTSTVHEAYPQAEMHWTEGGPDYTSPDYQTDWVNWGQVFTGALRNWCGSVTAWNLALDELGRPNIGPFPCGGLVTINSKTKEITQSGQFWAFAHFSRTVRRGAHRIESSSNIPGVRHVAFENPDAKRVLVVTNPGPACQIRLQIAQLGADITLDQNSVTSFSWS